MSLTLDDLNAELREYFARVEEVLSGMDAVVAKLQDRVAALEGMHRPSNDMEDRIARLEGQLAALVDAISDDDSSGVIVSGD